MDVNDVVQIKIAEAARRIAAARRRRAELETARQAGLPRRHSAKLRAQAASSIRDTDPTPPTAVTTAADPEGR